MLISVQWEALSGQGCLTFFFHVLESSKDSFTFQSTQWRRPRKKNNWVTESSASMNKSACAVYCKLGLWAQLFSPQKFILVHLCYIKYVRQLSNNQLFMRSDASSLREMDFGLGMFSTFTGRCQFQGGKLKCCYSGCPAVFTHCLKDATQ